MNIIAYQNGNPVGYIRSVSYKSGRFALTQNKANAKGYRTQDEVMGEIDILTRFAAMRGYIFIMSS